jgi:1-phosphatidylinositol-4-phosphate 5-kinase
MNLHSQEPIDYMMCVCGNFDYLEFISNAKSGQFFFYTHDRQFMIKTQTKAESKFMRSLLPQYYKVWF